MARRMIERRRRGFFGWIFTLVFWGWNALMAIWAFRSVALIGEAGQRAMTEAEQAGHALGAGLGFTFILLIWVCGAVIFGLLAYFTRGRREMIEMET